MVLQRPAWLALSVLFVVAIDAAHAVTQNLGTEYLQGIALYRSAHDEGDLNLALHRLGHAADHGYMPAQLRLGFIHLYGPISLRDSHVALWNFQRAANKGSAEAAKNCGLINLGVIGIEPNYPSARAWFEKAARLGNADAKGYLGRFYLEGLGVAPDAKLAKALLESGVARGSDVAATYLGLLYDRGEGVKKNHLKALALFKKAAAHHNALAQGYLGLAYLDGLPKDIPQAMIWLTKAAAQNIPFAQFELATLTLQRAKTPSDTEHAVALFRQAAEAGYAPAQNEMGARCMEGRNVAKDPEQGRDWYRRSAATGDTEGQYRMAVLCGDSQNPTCTDRHQWLAQATQHGRRDAAALLCESDFITFKKKPKLRHAGDAVDLYQVCRIGGTDVDLKESAAAVKILAKLERHYLAADDVREAEKMASQWFAQHPAETPH